MGPKWLLLPPRPLLQGYETLNNTRWLAHPNRGCSQFPQFFWGSYDYLTHCQSEDSHAR